MKKSKKSLKKEQIGKETGSTYLLVPSLGTRSVDIIYK